MPIPTHLLERAYQLINANQLQNAELVLDAVVRVQPQNMEAWKTYLMIHKNQQHDLNWLKERILKTRELCKSDKVKLIEYYHCLTEQLGEAGEDSGQTNPPMFFLQEEKDAYASVEGTDNGFELLDVFDYPEKIIKRENRARPRPRLRRRAVYNPFTIFADSVLKPISEHPIGRKFATKLKKPITLVKSFIKDPKDTYARFSRSPHFKMYNGFLLLILFILGVRIVMSNNFLGYTLLGAFVIGSLRWLSNNEGYNPGQARVYLHENSLPVVKEKEETDQDQNSTGENFLQK